VPAESVVESFEARILFHLDVQQPIADQAVDIGAPATTIDLNQAIFNEDAGPTVRLDYGALGTIDLQLLERQAPLSVANFLGYVNAGTYDHTVMHRSEPGFVVQGGGYTPTGVDISPPGTPTVPNEFSPQRSNVRGTVAYAKANGLPNSATSEFFFNLSDDNAGLDASNGGFTVFARVLGSGMTVADAIAALNRVNASPISFAFNHMPVTRITDPTLTPVDPVTSNGPSQTPQEDQMVVLSSATVTAPTAAVTYAATSSNPELVAPQVSGSSLVLNYVPGQTGTATITVTATEAGTGATATDTFVAAVGGTQVSLGDGANAQVVQFIDDEGTVSRLTVKGGTAAVQFTGNDVAQSPADKKLIVVNGTDLTVSNLILTGKNPSVTLKTTGGDSRVAFNAITADGPVRGVTGSSIVLTGPAVFNNAVGRLTLGRSERGSITINRSGSAGFVEPLITIGDAVDTNITSQAPLKLRLGSWTATDSGIYAITTPAIRTMVVNGNFDGQLAVSGNGQRVGSPAVANARIGGVLSGLWDVGSLNTLRAGSIDQAVIRAVSTIGSVLTGSINQSTIFAGLPSDAPPKTLPAASADLGTGSIRSFAIVGRSTTPQFVGSNIAASSLGRMNLGTVQENHSGAAFGLAASTVASLSALTSAGQPIRAARLTDPSVSIDQGDFEVRVQ
jgi:peptidyl-prolyl cis-trans isomerase A (cyclophilin A)